MEFNIEKSCCFTGHRPGKLNGTEETIRARLKEEIRRAVEDGYETFITGMAIGVDVWAAEEVLKLKDAGNGKIKLVAAVPFPGVEKNRYPEEKARYKAIIDRCDGVECICEGYARFAFTKRDEWMVDRVSLVIAVFNGTPGGTAWTVKYAQKKGRTIWIIEDV